MIDWLRVFAPYYDYGWFIALLAWAATLFIGRLTVGGRPGWSWLPWAAWTGVLSAAVELGSFAWPAPSIGWLEGPLLLDVLLGLLAAIAVAGWVWMLPVRTALRVLACFAVLAAAYLRIDLPAVGAFAVAGAGVMAALAHALGREADRRARSAVIVAALALWLSSVGPLASLGLQPRRSIVFGEWSPVWSFAQAFAAVVALAAVLEPWFNDRERRLEWRAFFAGCIAWLVLGLGVAAAMSASARLSFEAQVVARAQMAAALMNKTALENLLGPKFQLGEISSSQRPDDGSRLWQARVPRLKTDGYEVQHALAVIGGAAGNSGYFAFVFTSHAGWIVTITPEGYSANPLRKDRRDERVGLKPETPEDLLDWVERRASVLPLLVDNFGRANTRARVRAPLVTDQGRMLGWLVMEFPRAQWFAAQVDSRAQAYAIVAFGFVLAGMVAMQRVRTSEREAARAAATAATQADRLKTAFLAKVSHELRTPIQSVLGYGQLLRAEVHAPIAQRRLAALREHGELMLRLVNDLLDLSAIQAGAFRLVPRPAALGDLVAQTAESLRPSAEAKGLALSVTVDTGVPGWAEVDRERVRQVVLNLVGNAIKFTDHGRVEVELVVGAGPDEVALVVRDTGPGIPAAGIAKLFQPFERLDATTKKEGTGLGLALTAGICRGMGGEVAVESAVGAGATFRARFRAPACAAPLNLGRSSGALPPLAGRHVLVADDNALVRELFVTSLEEAGAHCTAVTDGAEALAAVERETFDVIVLDLSMPRIDGIEVTRRLRAGNRPARIIGVSAHAGEREKEEALSAGMDAFLVKPVSLDVLLAAIMPPSVENRAPVVRTEDLVKRLREQFHKMSADEGAALAAAIKGGDFNAAYLRAHHLMNSAAVIKDDTLFEACVRVENAARNRDAEELAAAWSICEGALEPWKISALPRKPASPFRAGGAADGEK